MAVTNKDSFAEQKPVEDKPEEHEEEAVVIEPSYSVYVNEKGEIVKVPTL